jgi:ketoreductase RED2
LVTEEGRQAVALVTGSTSGIGLGIATRLLADGMVVVFNSRGGGDLSPARGHGASATYLAADVADPADAEALVAAVESRFGRLDLLVNNAAVGPTIPHRDLASATPEVWDAVLGVNLLGPWHVIRAAVPILQQSSRAHVVNIASIAGVQVRGSSVPYATSKAALVHLTKLLARALSPGIRVNAVAPGWIDTPRSAGYPVDKEALLSSIPLHRTGSPAEVAAAVVALDSLSYVTGDVLMVDGGLHLT